jgi:hypothetical protein
MGFAESKFSEDDPGDSCRGGHPKLEFTYENNLCRRHLTRGLGLTKTRIFEARF